MQHLRCRRIMLIVSSQSAPAIVVDGKWPAHRNLGSVHRPGLHAPEPYWTRYLGTDSAVRPSVRRTRLELGLASMARLCGKVVRIMTENWAWKTRIQVAVFDMIVAFTC